MLHCALVDKVTTAGHSQRQRSRLGLPFQNELNYLKKKLVDSSSGLNIKTVGRLETYCSRLLIILTMKKHVCECWKMLIVCLQIFELPFVLFKMRFVTQFKGSIFFLKKC